MNQWIDWEEAKTKINFGIDSFINNLAETKRVNKSYFDNWKFSLFNMVEEKISRLSNNVIVREINSVFKNEDAKA